MANCMASMYVLIFTLMLNKLKYNKSNFNMLNIILLIISLYMLGTRVASYFPVIILSATIIMLLVIKVLTKNKLDKLYLRKVLILLIVTLIILPIAPISHRSYDYKDNLNSEIDYNFDNVEDKLADYKKQYDSGIYNKDEIVKFMRENSFSFLVHIEFLDAYRIEDDLEFWINYFMTDREIRGDNRVIEKAIISRIKERNFETKHKLFGYTYTNTFGRGIIYERDLFAQYFYLGIIGVLLFLCPYVFICIYVGIMTLKNIKKVDFETTMLLMGVCITIVISILSGNSMEHFCVVIPLSIACGYMLKRVKKVY